jgi:hypothetical protein
MVFQAWVSFSTSSISILAGFQAFDATSMFAEHD